MTTDLKETAIIIHTSEAKDLPRTPTVPIKAKLTAFCCRRWTQIPLAVGGSITTISTIALSILGQSPSLEVASPYLLSGAAIMGLVSIAQAVGFWDIRNLAPLPSQLEETEAAIKGLKDLLQTQGVITQQVNNLKEIPAAIKTATEERRVAHEKLLKEWQLKVDATTTTIEQAAAVNTSFQKALNFLGTNVRETKTHIEELRKFKTELEESLKKFSMESHKLAALLPTLHTALEEQNRTYLEYQRLLSLFEGLKSAEQKTAETIRIDMKQLDESDDKFLAASAGIKAEREKIEAIQKAMDATVRIRAMQLEKLAIQLPALEKIKKELSELVEKRDRQLQELRARGTA